MKTIFLLLFTSLILWSCTKESVTNEGYTVIDNESNQPLDLANTWWHLDSIVYSSVTILSDKVYIFENSNYEITNFEINPNGVKTNHWFSYNWNTKLLRLQGTVVNDTNEFTVNVLNYNKLEFTSNSSPIGTYHFSN